MGIFDRFFRPPSPAEFVNILIAALKQARDDFSFEYDPDINCVRAFEDGTPANIINPVNLHKAYCSLPRQARKPWLRSTCAALLNPTEMPADFDDVRPHLRPALRSRSMLDFIRLQAEVDGGTWKESPSIAISEYLVACLVYNLPQAMRFVGHDDLESWGTPLYLAMEAATQNLEKHTPEMYARIGESLYIIHTGDGYDATRMLALDMMERLEVQGDLIALPVNRDRLLLTGSEDEGGLMLMARFAEDDADEGRPVCSIPHVLAGDAWEVWKVPMGHVAEEPFRLLAAKSIGREYAEQEVLLQTWLDAKDIDAFVAAYSGLEHASDGRMRSWCVWSKGVTTWLPKTEIIAFFDPDLNARTMVTWESAVAEFGSLMRPMECWPPRWAVDSFPDEVTLQELKLEGW